jgi:hypothetical protein
MVVAEEDRPLVRPIVEAVTRRGADVVDEPDEADAAVLMASPRAAASAEVDRLLAAWTERNPAGDIVVVLLAGRLDWNMADDAFDPAATTALSSPAQGLFATRPLWLDARGGIDGPLAAKVAAAVAPAPPVEPAPAFAPPAPPVQATRPTAAPPPQPDAPRPPRSRRTGLLVLVGSGLVAVAAVATVVVVTTPSPSPTPTTSPTPPPEPSGGGSWWPALLVGVGLGIAVALLVSWLSRRRRPAQSTRPPDVPRLVAPVSAPPRPIVFISHDVDADHALAVRLAGDLRPAVEVWMAPESIEPGEPWLTSVERGLGLSRVVLALLSRASLASPWVIKEIQAAMELEVRQRLRLVPVQVEECDVPILLRTYQLMRLAAGYHTVVDQTTRLAVRPLPQ